MKFVYGGLAVFSFIVFVAAVATSSWLPAGILGAVTLALLAAAHRTEW